MAVEGDLPSKVIPTVVDVSDARLRFDQVAGDRNQNAYDCLLLKVSRHFPIRVSTWLFLLIGAESNYKLLLNS